MLKGVHGVMLGVFLFVLLLSNSSFAQTPSPVESTSPDEVEATISAKPGRVEYELPYPGMLPDNPLYFLKMIRDGIVRVLINDPFKKAEFNLLNAQKRMYAAKFLAEKEKDELSYETITKSNNYLHEAIASIQTVRKNNPKNTNVRPFLDQTRTVVLKHEEVLGEIKKEIDKQYLDDIAREEKRINDIQSTVGSLLDSRP